MLQSKGLCTLWYAQSPLTWASFCTDFNIRDIHIQSMDNTGGLHDNRWMKKLLWAHNFSYALDHWHVMKGPSAGQNCQLLIKGGEGKPKNI